MKGFFTIQKKKTSTTKVLSCTTCGLYQKVHSPKIPPYGNFKKEILVIGEAPGKEEDRVGKPWQGKAGQLLQRELLRLGVNLFEDCISINAVNCRPMTEDEYNRAPTQLEIDCCRKTVLDTIKEYQPQVVLLLGSSAVNSVIGYRWQRDLGGIMKWRGWTIPDQDFNTWICPAFHPSYVMRAEKDPQVKTVWRRDLQQAISMLNVPFRKYVKPKITYLTDLSPLNDIKHGTIAFDYETTGIKPQAEGHKIISVSVANTPDHVYAFLLPKERAAQRPLIRLLKNRDVSKMAHNMKYEDTWSAIRLHTQIQGWYWDSMLAAHILDNRPGVTSLKFQVYVNFGIVDYESEVSPYLKSKSKDGNALNNIEKLLETKSGVESLLYYNALDSVYEYRLAMLQQEIMKYDPLPF